MTQFIGFAIGLPERLPTWVAIMRHAPGGRSWRKGGMRTSLVGEPLASVLDRGWDDGAREDQT